MIKLTPELLPEILKTARAGREVLAGRPIAQIVGALNRVGLQWKKGGTFYERALAELPGELSFSHETIESSISLLPELLNEKNLTARVRADFGDPSILDNFVSRENFEGLVRFVPHGILLHVSAGNVFLGFVDSLILGFLTKNYSVVKVSSANQVFPRLFEESVSRADVDGVLTGGFTLAHWSGGDAAIEDALKNEVDAVIAWGGDEMIQSYRKGLPTGIPLLEHGPKISFQVLSKQGLSILGTEAAAAGIAADVCAWDQAACASPQNLFVEEGVDLDVLLPAIGRAFEAYPLPRGEIDADEAVEILKEEYRAKMSAFDGGGRCLKGSAWLIHFDPRPGLRPSALNRTLIVKTYKDLEDLLRQLEPGRRVLQSCGYGLSAGEKQVYLNRLAAFGCLRFAPVGSVMEGMIGAPHDGRLSLMELGRLVGDERKNSVYDFVNDIIRSNAFYGRLYDGKVVHKPEDLIALKSLEDLPLPEAPGEGGYVFSSGGTSGKAKYVFFTSSEFDRVGEMLSRSYKAQGLKNGDVCANLFVAGNLWSSFLAVEKALLRCGAIQLPIGGQAESDLILSYLEKFKPRALFGLPSMLVDLALKSRLRAAAGLIKIEKVFYAGEHLTQQGREILAGSFGVKEFHSAGYASVDAGPIGYQCRHCRPREHHVFGDFVHLEIQNGEGIVTSLVRKQMPVVHLRTGDHLEWSDENGPCPCGSNERRFFINGRIDGQMRIWSSRVLLSEVEEALRLAGIDAPIFQVSLGDDGFGETMTVRFESESPAQKNEADRFAEAFHAAARDLKATHPLTYLNGRLNLERNAPFSLPRVQRTGKIRPVVDLRKI